MSQFYNRLIAKETNLERLEFYRKRKLELFRIERERQFKAFDIHKSNVAYGVTQETPEQHAAVVTWYNAMRAFPEAMTDTSTEADYPVMPPVIETEYRRLYK